MRRSFSKNERLKHTKDIEELFKKGSSYFFYPLTVKVLFVPANEQTNSTITPKVLFSVPKKKFKHATDRNLLKRRMREAYRLNKHLIAQNQPTQNVKAIGFIFAQNQLLNYAIINKGMVKALRNIFKTATT